MIKFDLERVTKGELLEYRDIREWVWARFVGITSLGNPVIELLDGRVFDTFPNSLRILPKKVTVRYRNYMFTDCIESGVSTVNESDQFRSPESVEKMYFFRGWIHTEWQTAEIQSDLTDKDI